MNALVVCVVMYCVCVGDLPLYWLVASFLLSVFLVVVVWALCFGCGRCSAFLLLVGFRIFSSLLLVWCGCVVLFSSFCCGESGGRKRGPRVLTESGACSSGGGSGG
jgi:hypothetical protein